MIPVFLLRNEIITHAEWSFARSSGAGGQNVNKVNTKSTLRVPISKLGLLSEAQKDLVRERLSSRIFDDALTIHVQDERSQFLNREIALDRLGNLILDAVTPVKERRRTRPTRASRERRLAGKRLSSVKKSNRRNGAED